MAEKTESQLEAQAQAATLGLARLRRPKLEAIQAIVAAIADRTDELTAHRDALHDCAARSALTNLISVVTSARTIVTHEIAKLPQEPTDG